MKAALNVFMLLILTSLFVDLEASPHIHRKPVHGGHGIGPRHGLGLDGRSGLGNFPHVSQKPLVQLQLIISIYFYITIYVK